MQGNLRYDTDKLFGNRDEESDDEDESEDNKATGGTSGG